MTPSRTFVWVRGDDLPQRCVDPKHGRLAVGQWSLRDTDFDPDCPTCERMAKSR
jgi:hypothetical protein